MKTNHKLAVAVLAGATIGGAGTGAIHARQIKTPPAYVIAEVEVRDPTALQKYAEKAPGIVATFNGHYLVATGTGQAQALEGEAPKGFIVVIAFDSAEKAHAWYDSPPYEAIKPIRQGATKSRIYIVEGVAPH